MIRVLGLDISSTSTGVCLPDGSTTRLTLKHDDYFQRGRHMKRMLQEIVVDAIDVDRPITHAMLEAVGTSMIQSARTLSEVHGMFKDLLLTYDVVLLPQVAPSSLKKYATGSGASTVSKSEMTMAAARNGYTGSGQEDEVDAWWLHALGMHLLGSPVVEVTAYRSEVIANLMTDKKATKKADKKARADAAAQRTIEQQRKAELRAAKAELKQLKLNERAFAKDAAAGVSGAIIGLDAVRIHQQLLEARIVELTPVAEQVAA